MFDDTGEQVEQMCEGHLVYVACDDDNGGNQIVRNNCKQKDCPRCMEGKQNVEEYHG